jgi:hypothetical protein
MSFFRSGYLIEVAQASAHASERYRPSRVVPTAEMAFAQWTERVAHQPALVTARELAGLANENLVALAKEFEQAPRRRRSSIQQYWGAGSSLLTLLGMACLLLSHGDSHDLSTWFGVIVLLIGVAGLGVWVMRGLAGAPTEQAYAWLGLYVGELDEQHPWLYRTALLMKNAAADDYRQRVLRERGPLRGADYLMMSEIANVHEGVELTQTARAVRERVQGLSALATGQQIV